MREERDGSGAVTKQFFPRGQTIGSTVYFYTLDHLGNIREMGHMSGGTYVLDSQWSYDAWLNPIQIAGTGAVPDFLGAGMYYHQRSGQYFTMYRAYSPTLGRWLSRDPIGERAGTNLFAYVGNSPANNIDPMGLFAPSPSDVQQAAQALAAVGTPAVAATAASGAGISGAALFGAGAAAAVAIPAIGFGVGQVLAGVPPSQIDWPWKPGGQDWPHPLPDKPTGPGPTKEWNDCRVSCHDHGYNEGTPEFDQCVMDCLHQHKAPPPGVDRCPANR